MGAVYGHNWVTGQKLTFHPGETPSDKPARKGEFVKLVEKGKNSGLNICEVKLTGDPFTVCVYEKQLKKVQSPSETESEEHTMVTSTKRNAKQLRQAAKSLDIDGWEELSLADLRTAVDNAEGGAAAKPAKKTARKAAAAPEPEVVDDEDEDIEDEDDDDEEVAVAPPRKGAAKKAAPAKKSAAKKAAPAKKSAAKAAPAPVDDTPNENGNPYKKGSNLYEITELLIAGGKRSALVTKLKRKITITPRAEKEDWDEDKELDRRLLITAQILEKNFGFVKNLDGRGADAKISVEAP